MRELKGFDKQKIRNQDRLKTEILKEWKKEDIKQLIYIKILLKEYIIKFYKKEDLK